MQTYFNSRPYVRGDFWIFQALCTLIVFQFTPLREGRLSLVFSATSYGVFQFTPLREGRPFFLYDFCSAARFQFTPLREGRPTRSAGRLVDRYFNSRPYVRGDLRLLFLPMSIPLFQFTPLREGRQQRERAESVFNISIHAPT